jgi:hypothetical protein
MERMNAPKNTTYGSIGDFIYRRRERLYSRERDVGLRWRDGGALHRAAWIEDTGELYLVQLGPPHEGGGRVELLVAGVELEDLEEAVSGWREAQDESEHSLEWLRDRARRLVAPDGAMAAS